jgi:HEAT repeat protein
VSDKTAATWHGRDMTDLIEALCEVMHDAYEAAAAEKGWETQERSRKPWAAVPEANKATMRVAVRAMLAALAQAGYGDTRALLHDLAELVARYKRRERESLSRTFDGSPSPILIDPRDITAVIDHHAPLKGGPS